MKFSFLLLLLLSSTFLFSQNARITGKVVSSKTGEPIIGATVFIEGTKKGVSCDLNGVYTLGNLSAGTYSLAVSHVSFAKKTITDVAVKSGEIVYLNVTLEDPKANEADNVVVRSKFNRANTNALLATQKNSPTVSDGISAEAIRKTPDRTTSDVIKRVSGASIQDDRFVIIRGLNDRYNTAFLNNAPLPSSESDRKAFAFDIFPSNILDNLVIYKTASPDMTGEFGGGIINVTTKSIPVKNFTTVSLGLGYNTISTFKDKTYYKGGKWDFIGLDDGTRAIPSQIPSIEEFNKLLPKERAAYSKYFDNNWELKTKEALPYGMFQITQGLNYQKKGSDFLGVLLSLTYNNNSVRSEGEKNIFDYDRSAPSEEPQWKDRYKDVATYNQTLLGALANVSLKLNSNNSITWKNILSINSDDRVVKRVGTPDYVGDPTFEARINGRMFTSNLIYSSQLAGNHILNKSNLRLDWLGAYSHVTRSIPDLRQSIYFGTHGSDFYADVAATRPVPDNGGTHFYSQTNENISSAKIDLTQPFVLGKNIQSQFKAGFNYQHRSRNFDARLLGFNSYNSNGVNFDYGLLTLPEDKIFASENMGGDLGDGRGGFSLGDGTQPTYVYDARSDLTAGYAMLDQRFGKKFRAIYGLRIENYHQVLNSVNTFYTPIHIKTDKTDPLPSVNLVYSLTTKQNIRFAYSQTVNRPEFREVAPFVFYDFVTRYTVEGDTGLQRSLITNYDLRYEFYPGRSQLFSVSGFYKDFTNPIELVSNPNGSRSAVYSNANSAKVYGVEAEIRSLIGPLVGARENSLLDNLTVSGNVSFLWSNIKLNDFGQISVKDLNTDRNLQGQSPYVINAGLSYANVKYGITTTLSANRSGARIYIVGTKNDVDIYEQGRTVTDFQFAKTFLREKWELKLNVKDLLAQKQVFFYDIDQNKTYDKNADRIFSANSFGRVISLTATYKF